MKSFKNELKHFHNIKLNRWRLNFMQIGKERRSNMTIMEILNHSRLRSGFIYLLNKSFEFAWFRIDPETEWNLPFVEFADRSKVNFMHTDFVLKSMNQQCSLPWLNLKRWSSLRASFLMKIFSFVVPVKNKRKPKWNILEFMTKWKSFRSLTPHDFLSTRKQ